MVDALASDRSDQSFGKAVLPRRAWSDRFVADAHGSQSMPDGNAIDLIPIADQVARGLIPRECLCDLTDQRHTSSNRRLDRATEQFEEEAKVLWVALVRCRGHQKIVVRHRRQRLTELVGERLFVSAVRRHSSFAGGATGMSPGCRPRRIVWTKSDGRHNIAKNH